MTHIHRRHHSAIGCYYSQIACVLYWCSTAEYSAVIVLCSSITSLDWFNGGEGVTRGKESPEREGRVGGEGVTRGKGAPDIRGIGSNDAESQESVAVKNSQNVIALVSFP